MDGLNSLKRLIFGDIAPSKPHPVTPSIKPRKTEEEKHARNREQPLPATAQTVAPPPEKTESVTPAVDDCDRGYTVQELRNGFKMSVILGEPLGKRGYGYRRRS